MLEAQLDAERHKCRLATQDLANCDKLDAADELLKLAWLARDEAVERKNAVQVSLAKSRIETMQVSSQLMEAVQQKAELSHRLAQFEVSASLSVCLSRELTTIFLNSHRVSNNQTIQFVT